MSPSRPSREAALADLVAGLLDARADPATARFDAELEAAEAAGRIDAATARLLRWWQRESLRTVTEHVRTVIPAAIASLDEAAEQAEESVSASARAWEQSQRTSNVLDLTLHSASGSGPESDADEDSEAPRSPESAPRTARHRTLVAGLTQLPRPD